MEAEAESAAGAPKEEKRGKAAKGGKGGRGRGKGKAKKGDAKGEDAGRTTELHSAARSGDAARLGVLLTDAERAKEVNVPDQHRRTPLHLAAFFGQAAAVQSLLEGGADVGCEAADGFLALHFAAQGGHLEVLRALVRHVGSKGEHGAIKRHINRVVHKGKKSALHLAVLKDHADCARFLVMKGASTELQTAQGQTALDICKSPELRRDLTGDAAAASAADEGEPPAKRRAVAAADGAAGRGGAAAAAARPEPAAEAAPAVAVPLPPMHGLPHAPPPCAASAAGAVAYGPLALDRVEVTASEAERTFPAGMAELAEVHWRFSVEETPALAASDGPVWCVLSHRAPGAGAEILAPLSLTLQRSTYRMLLYTRLSEEGRLLPADQQCPACGLTVLTETADGLLLLARPPAGAGREQAWRAVPAARALASALLREAVEGALRQDGLGSALGSARLLGLLAVPGSDDAHAHELVVGVRTPLSAAEVLAARTERAGGEDLLFVKSTGRPEAAAPAGAEATAFEDLAEAAAEGAAAAGKRPVAGSTARALRLLKELRTAASAA